MAASRTTTVLILNIINFNLQIVTRFIARAFFNDFRVQNNSFASEETSSR